MLYQVRFKVGEAHGIQRVEADAPALAVSTVVQGAVTRGDNDILRILGVRAIR